MRKIETLTIHSIVFAVSFVTALSDSVVAMYSAFRDSDVGKFSSPYYFGMYFIKLFLYCKFHFRQLFAYRSGIHNYCSKDAGSSLNILRTDSHQITVSCLFAKLYNG